MSSPARYINSSEKSLGAFSNTLDARFKVEGPIAHATSGLTAFSFEFVAKPDEATSPLRLPVTIQSGLEDIAGFAGSLVMISDQKARLITVIIFWSGTEGAAVVNAACAASTHALLRTWTAACASKTCWHTRPSHETRKPRPVLLTSTLLPRRVSLRKPTSESLSTS